MDKGDLIEKTALDLLAFIEVSHREGLSYWELLRLFLLKTLQLQMKAEMEYYSKGGK